MMNATKKLCSGVYQVIGTDWAIRNDCRRCWYLAKVVNGLASYDLKELFFINGTRNDAIQYAKELQMTN